MSEKEMIDKLNTVHCLLQESQIEGEEGERLDVMLYLVQEVKNNLMKQEGR